MLRLYFGDEKRNHPIDSGNEFTGLLHSHRKNERESESPGAWIWRELLVFHCTFRNKIVMVVIRESYKMACPKFLSFFFWHNCMLLGKWRAGLSQGQRKVTLFIFSPALSNLLCQIILLQPWMKSEAEILFFFLVMFMYLTAQYHLILKYYGPIGFKVSLYSLSTLAASILNQAYKPWMGKGLVDLCESGQGWVREGVLPRSTDFYTFCLLFVALLWSN